MDVLEKLQMRVKQEEAEGNIQTKEEVQLYVSGYIKGLYDQNLEEYCNLTDNDVEKLKGWACSYYDKPFYFTFGSSDKFPYQDGFLIVMASNIVEAIHKFKSKFPNRDGGKIVNCSDWYDVTEWQRILEDGYYQDQKPFGIIK